MLVSVSRDVLVVSHPSPAEAAVFAAVPRGMKPPDVLTRYEGVSVVVSTFLGLGWRSKGNTAKRTLCLQLWTNLAPDDTKPGSRISQGRLSQRDTPTRSPSSGQAAPR